MRSLSSLILLLATQAFAQSPPSVERVRVGLPTGLAGQDAGCTRNGAWAPVAITLRGGKEGNPQGAFRLRIETTDLEEIAYQTTLPVPALAADSLRTVQGYIVPGGDGSTFRIHLDTADGQLIRSQPRTTREVGRDVVINREDALYLAAGAGLAQLKRTAEKRDQADAKADPLGDQGRHQFVYADDVTQLPDRWVGYDAVDVVFLTTGKRDFVLQLAQDSESARRTALLEWVRKGGTVVVSVGRNKQEVAQLLPRLPLLDCKVTGSETVASLPVLSTQWCRNRGQKTVLQNVEVATLSLGKSVDVLVRDARKPVLAQAACGLGRVVLVAFDLDAPPFAGWEGQEEFYKRLEDEIAPLVSARGKHKPAGGPVQPGFQVGGEAGADSGDVQMQMKRGLENFEEAPVIPFGWVALFILFYIALVGPLDYFVLKKLFKRLELTWVTFPASVIAVSVVAYLVAYKVKGTDLRINKVDLVDIDLHAPMGEGARQVYGTSWFTLFSPRVASYTIGIEPSVDVWTAAPPAGAPGPVVTLLEAGERTMRAGSQALFRRPYEYADEAVGLRRVPIPVWATRSFTASWRAPVLAKSPVIGIHDDVGPIRLARDGPGLVGRITNQLPVRLQDVTLFYRDHWYYLENLEPGEQKRLEPLFGGDARGQSREVRLWFADKAILRPGLPVAPTGRGINAAFQQGRSAYELVKKMMFFRASEGGGSNGGLRRFDESWRLRELPEYPAPERPRYRDECILVARTPMLTDHFADVSKHAASPSRLWLGKLPGDGDWPEQPGYLTQETYLRVFIPVQTDR